MALEFSATGRPGVKCPVCGRVHFIFRRGDYLEKSQTRFHCKNPECRAKWNARPDEQEEIRKYFEAYAGRGRGRPCTKKKKDESDPKPPVDPKPNDDPKPKDKPKDKKSWIDEIWG